MDKYGPPTEPTPFAKWLGIPLGEFDRAQRTYTVTVKGFNPQAVNHFGTLHGGIIGAACDDICGMTVYFKNGVNSAVIDNITTYFHKPVRPTSTLTFVCQMSPEIRGTIHMNIIVKRGDEVVAHATSTWHLTSKFLKCWEEKKAAH